MFFKRKSHFHGLWIKQLVFWVFPYLIYDAFERGIGNNLQLPTPPRTVYRIHPSVLPEKSWGLLPQPLILHHLDCLEGKEHSNVSTAAAFVPIGIYKERLGGPAKPSVIPPNLLPKDMAPTTRNKSIFGLVVLQNGRHAISGSWTILVTSPPP